MKTMMRVFVFAAVLLQHGAFCGESDATQRMETKLSDLDKRVSRIESILYDLGTSLYRTRYYRPSPKRKSKSREEDAKLAAMSVDELADLILDLEDQLEKAGQTLSELRRGNSRGFRRSRGGDKQQRRKELLAEFAAEVAYNRADKRVYTLRKLLYSARRALERKAAVPPVKQEPRHAPGKEVNP